MENSEAHTESVVGTDTQSQIPPPSQVTPETPSADEEDDMFAKKDPAPKRKRNVAPKNPPTVKKPKVVKQKPAITNPKQQPPMSALEVEFLIEARLKCQNQFEGTISKNEDIWKLIAVEHNTKFELARRFSSLRERYSVETELYRACWM
ncbi:hypothetical protein CYMTET_45631 [Cymbomonas tetramitiformis]|uniref:Uncharacterized protein n=1 Tax=Cymbomonas tetramitiformis TaxID=36881 RepID=A0AAE0BZ06_9CHLO|nr:hypothetical protein CYMTET_45631 [Cymbomonas tetramitiformis]